jgi:hypothetical protein
MSDVVNGVVGVASSSDLLEYLAGRDDQSHSHSSGSDAHIEARTAMSYSRKGIE